MGGGEVNGVNEVKEVEGRDGVGVSVDATLAIAATANGD
jgi:hypothetical protein